MNRLSRQKNPFIRLFFVLLFTYLFCCEALAAVFDQDPKTIPWHISALSVTYDNKRQLYIAEDNVVITGGKTRLEADYVEFSNKTKDAFAQGNVLLISGEDSISCNAMNINLVTEVGTINKGTIYIQRNNFYINGENIRKTGKFTYSADKGSITSCSGETPDWKITGKKVNVTVEGYGTAYNTVLWAKKMPAAYSPFLVFPVKTKRQTGLLFPRISSSERKGFEYEQPLFIAISRNTDATLYLDYMSDRGTKVGAEYRYVLDNESKGSVFFDFLEDDKIDDRTEKTELYSFNGTPQRTNTDRFWFRAKHDQALPNGFTAKLDIDVVSDADYLREFKDGFTGFKETDEHFAEEFGRDLGEYDSTVRKNWFNLRRQWGSYTFDFEALWYDNINARRQNTDDTTLQTLPAIQFDVSRKKIFETPVYYTLDSEFRSFYRKDTTATQVKGQRTNIYPKFYLPFRLGKSFNFEPSIGVRHTAWHTTDFTDSNGNSDDFRSREMYDLGADLSTKVFKIFDPQASFAEKIKHEIIPKLEWDYIPYISQSEFPSFDGIDRVAETNLLTWSVIQNFISRKTDQRKDGQEVNHYRNLAYVKLWQSFDIKKERDNQSKPFSNIALDAQLTPHDLFSLDTDLTWSPYDEHFKTMNIGGTLSDLRGDSLRSEYRFNSSSSESLFTRIDIALTDEYKTFYSFEKNLLTKKTIETNTGLTVAKSCWSLDLFYTETDSEQRITFLFNLYGIGEFGNK